METLAYALLFGLIAREAFGVPLLPSDHKPFIYGGEDAPEGYAPYMVALVVGDRVKSQWCGGSIISKSLALTAANCVEPLIMDDGSLFETFHTRVGSNQWNSGGTIVNIKDFHIHPEYDSKNYKNDVAVLVLRKEEIVLSERVAVIGMAFDYVGENEKCLVTGWGRTEPRMEGDVLHMQPTPDDLQALYTTTMSYELCQEQMTAFTGGRAPPIHDPVEMCTFHSVGHGMCSDTYLSELARGKRRSYDADLHTSQQAERYSQDCLPSGYLDTYLSELARGKRRSYDADLHTSQQAERYSQDCLPSGYLGDSGNALVRVSTVELIGFVSWGAGCAEGGPDVSVRISGDSIKDFLEHFLNLYQD